MRPVRQDSGPHRPIHFRIGRVPPLSTVLQAITLVRVGSSSRDDARLDVDARRRPPTPGHAGRITTSMRRPSPVKPIPVASSQEPLAGTGAHRGGPCPLRRKDATPRPQHHALGDCSTRSAKKTTRHASIRALSGLLSGPAHVGVRRVLDAAIYGTDSRRSSRAALPVQVANRSRPGQGVGFERGDTGRRRSTEARVIPPGAGCAADVGRQRRASAGADLRDEVP